MKLVRSPTPAFWEIRVKLEEGREGREEKDQEEHRALRQGNGAKGAVPISAV